MDLSSQSTLMGFSEAGGAGVNESKKQMKIEAKSGRIDFFMNGIFGTANVSGKPQVKDDDVQISAKKFSRPTKGNRS